MPLTLPTIYALRAVSIKNVSQRLIFLENLQKFKGSFILLYMTFNMNIPNYINSNCDYIEQGFIY